MEDSTMESSNKWVEMVMVRISYRIRVGGWARSPGGLRLHRGWGRLFMEKDLLPWYRTRCRWGADVTLKQIPAEHLRPSPHSWSICHLRRRLDGKLRPSLTWEKMGLFLLKELIRLCLISPRGKSTVQVMFNLWVDVMHYCG